MTVIFKLLKEARKYRRISSNFQGKALLRTEVNDVVYRKRERNLKDNGPVKY